MHSKDGKTQCLRKVSVAILYMYNVYATQSLNNIKRHMTICDNFIFNLQFTEQRKHLMHVELPNVILVKDQIY